MAVDAPSIDLAFTALLSSGVRASAELGAMAIAAAHQQQWAEPH